MGYQTDPMEPPAPQPPAGTGTPPNPYIMPVGAGPAPTALTSQRPQSRDDRLRAWLASQPSRLARTYGNGNASQPGPSPQYFPGPQSFPGSNRAGVQQPQSPATSPNIMNPSGMVPRGGTFNGAIPIGPIRPPGR